MQIFELYFNPKLKEGQVFDSFVYEPQNIYEKKLGSLYVIGELQNVLPQTSPRVRGPQKPETSLLNDLAKIIKRKYYTTSLEAPERALSESLKKANEFLSEEVKKDNVGWLGNLNFSVFSLKDFKLTFTKTGNLKILLIRNGQIMDIGKNLDLQEIEPYPLKIFFNTVSGKLILDDILLVLSKEIFEFFYQQNILSKIAQLEIFDEKKLKEILPPSLFTKDEGSKVSGVCFISIVKKELQPIKRVERIRFQKQEKFSFSLVFSPIFKLLRKIPAANFFKRFKPKFFRLDKVGNLLNKIWKGKKISPKLKPKSPKIVKGINLKQYKPLPQIKKIIESRNTKKRLILVLILIFFLFLGFLIFQNTDKGKENEIKVSLTEIQEKVNQAESFLIIGNKEKANSLFIEAWKEISPLTETKTSLKPDTVSLIQSIKENLENLNKLENIENPEEVLGLEYKKALTPLLAPENLMPFPEPDFSFDLFASYFSNLYFLDKKTCKIIKYPYLGASNWGQPQIWKEPDAHCSEPKSIAVDGSIWILNRNNSILRYHSGSFQEKINLDFFPLPEDISKIKTKPALPYLYLLEPIKKRIIIIGKDGSIVKQFQSEKFDDLKDFAISENNKIIYLLNGLKVYQIKL